jgi:hypothetical protein
VAGREREVFIEIARDLRIRFRRSEAPPPVSYAITLESLEDGGWTTVRLWDNADDVDEHHQHEYTRTGGKQSAVIRQFETANDAMAAAITEARSEAQAIVRQWRES